MALPDKLHLEIVTPEKQLFSGDVDSITVPAKTGYMGVLPGHAPLLAELGVGEIAFKTGDKTDFLFSSWGFMEVLPERVVVLAQIAELASDIDIKRAEEAKSRAEKMLSSKDPNVDSGRAQLALLRAISRINAYNHRKKQ